MPHRDAVCGGKDDRCVWWQEGFVRTKTQSKLDWTRLLKELRKVRDVTLTHLTQCTTLWWVSLGAGCHSLQGAQGRVTGQHCTGQNWGKPFCDGFYAACLCRGPRALVSKLWRGRHARAYNSP